MNIRFVFESDNKVLVQLAEARMLYNWFQKQFSILKEQSMQILDVDFDQLKHFFLINPIFIRL